MAESEGRMKRIVLIGASGHGKVCAEIAELSKEYAEIIFLDDNPVVKKCGAYDVRGTSNDLCQYINDSTDFFVSIGDAEHRKSIQERIEKAGGKAAILIHPNAVVSSDASIGTGTVVMAGAVINTGADIGRGCIVNTSSSVDHDCRIGDFCHIAVGSHVCGTVEIGESCWIGAGATVSNNLNIVAGVTVGAGAVVVNNLEKAGTYLGVPAKLI